MRKLLEENSAADLARDEDIEKARQAQTEANAAHQARMDSMHTRLEEARRPRGTLPTRGTWPWYPTIAHAWPTRAPGD